MNVSDFASFVVAGRRLSGAMRNFCKVVFYILTMRAVCDIDLSYSNQTLFQLRIPHFWWTGQPRETVEFYNGWLNLKKRFISVRQFV